MKYSRYLLVLLAFMLSFIYNDISAQDDIYFEPEIQDDAYVDDGYVSSEDEYVSSDIETEIRRVQTFCTTFNVTLMVYSNPLRFYEDNWYNPYYRDYFYSPQHQWRLRRYLRQRNRFFCYSGYYHPMIHGPQLYGFNGWGGYNYFYNPSPFHQGGYYGWGIHNPHYNPWGGFYFREGETNTGGGRGNSSIAVGNDLPPRGTSTTRGDTKSTLSHTSQNDSRDVIAIGGTKGNDDKSNLPTKGGINNTLDTRGNSSSTLTQVKGNGKISVGNTNQSNTTRDETTPKTEISNTAIASKGKTDTRTVEKKKKKIRSKPNNTSTTFSSGNSSGSRNDSRSTYSSRNQTRSSSARNNTSTRSNNSRSSTSTSSSRSRTSSRKR